jgi:hypothetical protein
MKVKGDERKQRDNINDAKPQSEVMSAVSRGRERQRCVTSLTPSLSCLVHTHARSRQVNIDCSGFDTD